MALDSSYYNLFGVDKTATQAQIRKAFRLKALQLHPDRNKNNPDATSAFQHLKAIFDILSDSERRANYDQYGPSANPHADEDGFDADALATFLARKAKPISKKDIAAYEAQYRNGPHEKEDLIAHFRKFQGDVSKALSYIPYSQDCDLQRFVTIWQQLLDDGELQSTPEWVLAHKTLLDQAKLFTDSQNSNSSTKRGKKPKSRKQTEDMSSLASLIQKRSQRGKEQFDNWCNKVEEQSKPSKSKRAKTSKPSDSPLKPTRKIAKRTSRRKQ